MRRCASARQKPSRRSSESFEIPGAFVRGFSWGVAFVKARGPETERRG